MNYKTVSSKNIIETVFARYRNYISQDSEGLLGNGIEWIGEALEAIGILPAMINETKDFTVTNGKIAVPCNLYLLESISYKGEWIPYGSQTFNYELHTHNCINEHSQCNLPWSYTINPNWIHTNIHDGENLRISYKAFMVDEEGYPQIPDKVTVKQALFWYITMMLCLGGFEHPQVNFDSSEQRWLKYCGQAENDLAMLDRPQRETFKNQWVRIFGTEQSVTRFNADIEPEIIPQHYKTYRL